MNSFAPSGSPIIGAISVEASSNEEARNTWFTPSGHHFRDRDLHSRKLAHYCCAAHLVAGDGLVCCTLPWMINAGLLGDERGSRTLLVPLSSAA